MLAMTSKTVLYSAWFCPYAQRVWMALNHFQIPFDLIESLDIDPQTNEYKKNPGLLEHNPKGLVPTLVVVVQDEKDQATDKRIYCDSIDILKELYAQQQSVDSKNNDPGNNIISSQYEEALHWNKRICSTFYQVLMRQSKDGSLQAWKEMQANLSEFSEHIDKPATAETVSFYKSFCADGTTPSIVDFTVFPFIYRLNIIEHYKKYQLADTTEQERSVKSKIVAWEKMMKSQASVHATLSDTEKLLRIYERYADGTAKSKVGESVRKGKDAHDV